MKLLINILLVLVSSLAYAGATDINVGWPIRFPGAATLSPAVTYAMSAQNEGISTCFSMPETATITTAGFLNSTLTGTATSIADNSYTISLQGISTNGLPDGTILGGGSPASATFPVSGSAGGTALGNNTIHAITLSNSISLSAGNIYCMVIRHTGATDAVNYITPRYGAGVTGGSVLIPYTLTSNSSSTWTKTTNPPAYLFLRSATKSYLLPSVSMGANVSFSSTTEYGYQFSLPTSFGTGATYKVCGATLVSGSSAPITAGTLSVALYSNLSGTPTILQQVQIPTDQISTMTASGGRNFVIDFPGTLANLSFGTTYGIGISTSNSGWSGFVITLPTANDATAYPMGGLAGISRALTDFPPSGNDTNSFSVTNTTLWWADLRICDVTVPAGGSSGGVY